MDRYVRDTYNRIQKKIERLSNKFFTKGKLTPAEWRFVEEFSEWFGDIKEAKSGKTIERTPRKGRREWFVNGRDFNSSWILRWRWVAPKGQHNRQGKGILIVNMKKMKYGEYRFFNFPYVEMVLLKHTKATLGTYWWKRWLWRYANNPAKHIRRRR